MSKAARNRSLRRLAFQTAIVLGAPRLQRAIARRLRRDRSPRHDVAIRAHDPGEIAAAIKARSVRVGRRPS